MSQMFIFLAALLAATSVPMKAAAAELEFDHVWIVVSRDAPERAALERAGLKVSPNVNRHDGQGTASITAEFLNTYIELLWPDPTVPVSPGAERGVEKFKDRMPPGTAIEILTPRDDTKSPSFFIEPPVLAVKEEANRNIADNDPKRASFQHPIGVKRVTEIRIVKPKAYQPIAAFTYLEKASIFKATEGKKWAIEITFDGGRKAQTKDLQPDLPLIIRY